MVAILRNFAFQIVLFCPVELLSEDWPVGEAVPGNLQPKGDRSKRPDIWRLKFFDFLFI